MKALKFILYTILGLGGLWMLLGIFAKKEYRIERSTEIDAPRDIVYEQVRLFKNFKNWSPWHVYDPYLKTEIIGTDGEPGALYTWSGNKKVGTGSQKLKSASPERVELEVQFSEWGTSPAYFVLKDNGSTTHVTWTLDMHIPFPWNAFAMLTDVNAFVGRDFADGLKHLKSVCEQIAHPKFRGYVVVETELPTLHYVGVRSVLDTIDIHTYFASQFPALMDLTTEKKLTAAGMPSGLFWQWGEQTDVAAAIPVEENAKLDSVETFSLGGKALMVDYFGPHFQTMEAHLAIDDYMNAKKLQSRLPVVEEYVTDPMEEPDTTLWLTRIIYFVEPKPDSTAADKK
ncbi:MAG: SRPBCC family protein [Saprospiraceae bacterium]|nr:SRPBCC family protein [Saprospiraceae bacterium]